MAGKTPWTPGPWKINRRGDEIMVSQGPSCGLTLATVTEFTPPHRSESDANSRLIEGGEA